MTRHRRGKPGLGAQDCRVPAWHIGEGKKLGTTSTKEQADQDNNEELPQDLNDLGTATTKEKKDTGEANCMEDQQLGLE